METEQLSMEVPLSLGRHKEIKDFLEFNKNERSKYRKFWETTKVVLRGQFIAPNAFIWKLEKSHTSDLTAHLRALQQKEENAHRRSRRRQETFKLRTKSIKYKP